jgi:hypothetical protein
MPNHLATWGRDFLTLYSMASSKVGDFDENPRMMRVEVRIRSVAPNFEKMPG